MWEIITRLNYAAILRLIIDFSIVFTCVFALMKVIQNNSRTIQIFKGVIIILLVKEILSFFSLFAIKSILDSILIYGPLSLVVLFAPEIRHILENVGKVSVFSKLSILSQNEKSQLIDELLKAVDHLSKSQIGALISIEQGNSLNEYVQTGVAINSTVSHELLENIFYPKTPLHDGAVIIQGLHIACASAFYPLTNASLRSSYGTRHRAALGISEVTDSLTIIVSEETGLISYAYKGELKRVDLDSLRNILIQIIGLKQNQVLSLQTIEEESENQIEVVENKLIDDYLVSKNVGKKDEYTEVESLENGLEIEIYYKGAKDEKTQQ